MKCDVYSYKTTEFGKNFIENHQKDWCIDFRRLYNNIELQKDENFLKTLRTKSTKLIEYLTIEVNAFYEVIQANKATILENIKRYEKELEDIKVNKKIKQKRKKALIEKKNNKIIALKRSYKKEVVFGDIEILKKLSKNPTKDKELLKEQWADSRLRNIIYIGNSLSCGNIHFDFKDLDKGIIIFKPNRKTKIPIQLNNINKDKKRRDNLTCLRTMALDKSIPVTIKLNPDTITIVYDDAKLAGTYKDLKGFYKTITHIKDKEHRKALIAAFHKEHENKLKEGKLNRALSVDLNPDGPGYAIFDIDEEKGTLKFIKLGYFDISKITDANKRRNDTALMVKEIFKLIVHYRCHSIVIEDFDFKNKNPDLGNKVANRKINNLWNRQLLEETIKRRCNETGTILVPTPPAYTSFIGNILYTDFDPISAAKMIGRRGIFQFSKKHNKDNCYPAIDLTHFINDQMYDKMKECSTWQELRSFFYTSRKSYRRVMDKGAIIEEYSLRDKSKTKHILFKVA